MSPYNHYQRREHPSLHEKANHSPVTPAVTGLEYPSVEDGSTDIESSRAPRGYKQQQFYTHPNIAASSIDDTIEPPSTSALDHVWDSIRQNKVHRMAKEKPKVQSLEEITQELLLVDQHQPMHIPVTEAHGSPLKSLKKNKSLSNFRESTDGRSVVATFDLPPEVAKQDIHISFQRNKLVLTWEYVDVVEWEDEGVLNRERTERYFNRSLPLPEGTRFEEIHAQMTTRGLTLRYPNMRSYRVDSHSRSGES